MKRLSISTAIILFVFQFVLKGQDIHIEGRTLDTETGTTLSYTSIGIPGKAVGTASDSLGNFMLNINPQYKEDTLVFSALGFQKYSVKLSDIKEGPLTVKLQPMVYKLNEVTILPSDWKKEIIGTSDKNRAAISASPWSNLPGGEIAVKLKADESPMFINKVFFYIDKKGRPNTSFRVRVYEANKKDGKPGKDLLPENVFAKAKKGNEWVGVDLSKYQIAVDEGIFFVSMEWYAPPKFNGQEAQFLGFISAKNDGQSLWKGPFGRWVDVKDIFSKNNVSGEHVVMIKAEMLKRKDLVKDKR